MKTSNILLTITLLIFFLVTLSSNFVLKNQFDKIDKDDKFYGFSKQPLGAFKYVRLQGNAVGLTEIQQGPAAELRMITLPQYLKHKLSGDTLILTYQSEPNSGNPGMARFGALPSFYIITPKLEGIISDNIHCVVKNYRFDNLDIRQKGQGLLLLNSTANNLTAIISESGFFKLSEKSRIANASVEIHDNSTLSTEKDIFEHFDMKIDSTAHISIPGSMIKRILTSKK